MTRGKKEDSGILKRQALIRALCRTHFWKRLWICRNTD